MPSISQRGTSSTAPNGAGGQPVSAAGRMLEMFATAAERAAGDGFSAATWTPGMGDVPRPHGLFSAALLGDAWPTESESALKDTAGGLKSRAERHSDAASAAKANTDKVFSSDWTDGAGAEAAYAHYQSEHEAHHALHTALDSAGAGTARIADSVGSAKVKMRTAHDDAHREIEEALRATPAGGIVNVAPILAKYRGQIHSYATELHGIVGDELSLFSASHNVPPLAPSGAGSGGNGQSTDGTNSHHGDQPTGAPNKDTDKGNQATGESSGGDKGSATTPGQGAQGDQPTGKPTEGGGQGQNHTPSGAHSSDVPSANPADKSAASDVPMVPTSAATSAGRAADLPTAAGAAKSTVPQMPSLPSTGAGASSSPLSGAASSGAGPLTGLMGQSPMGSAAGSGNLGAAGLANPSSLSQSAAVSAASSSVGDSMGKGIAAGTQAAGGGGAGAGGGGGGAGGGGAAGLGQLAKGPLTPLVPPLGAASAPTSAAPASAAGAAAPLSAASSPSAASVGSAGAAAASAGGGMGGMAPAATPMAMPAAPAPAAPAGGGAPAASTPLSPYGSVLPPSTTTPTTPAGSPPGPFSPGGPATAAAGAGGAAAAGFVPTLNDPAAGRQNRVSRDVSMSDLELARSAVADLASASSVVYPVLQWAVAVGRGSSGLPELWVATNEGNGFIPAGVFIPRSMALAARFDADFDLRWFGWTHPAETAVRAIQARGDTVSAVATSWPHDSNLARELTPDFAIGVVPSGNPAEAAATTLTRSRAHRLETLDAALFLDMQRSGDALVDSYGLLVTQEVAFNAGPELPGVAQSIARGILSRHWPTEADWAALISEYEGAVLMASAQRPGLFGVEDHTQLATYQSEYLQCRRMESLIAWRSGNVADVIYAARCAGVVLPLMAAAEG